MKNNKNWIQFNISPLEVSIKNIKIMGFVQYFTTRGLNKEQKNLFPVTLHLKIIIICLIKYR